VLAGGNGISHAITINGCILTFQVRDQVLVQRIRGKDDAFGEPFPVHSFTAFTGKVRQIPAVQPDPVKRLVGIVYAIGFKRFQRIGQTALECIIGVQKQDDPFSPVAFDIGIKRIILFLYAAAKSRNIAMGHGAGAGNVEFRCCQDI